MSSSVSSSSRSSSSVSSSVSSRSVSRSVSSSSVSSSVSSSSVSSSSVSSIRSIGSTSNIDTSVIYGGSFCRGCYRPVSHGSSCSNCDGSADLNWASNPSNDPTLL